MRIVVKFGGSAITDKGRRFSVRRRILHRLAGEVAGIDAELVIVHGGGSFGHPLAKKYSLAEGYRSPGQLVGASLTHSAMVRLNEIVIEALRKRGIPAFPVQPSSCMVVSNGRIRSAELAPVRKMLELGMVPVMYGDVVPDMERGLSILSGDHIVTRLALELGASRVVLGVDVDGVYTADPKTDENAELIPVITPKNVPHIGRIKAMDVTGGMGRKVMELVDLARRGIESQIVNALRPGALREALKGNREIGTLIRA
ncbi:MAG: isopentenyl phosphate kinase [Candidatus Hadarchaeales archaeon]